MVQAQNSKYDQGILKRQLRCKPFFAADLGGFVKHQRKMFELKAANLQRLRLTYQSVMKAYEFGTGIGNPWLVLHLSGCFSIPNWAIKAIQSASFGGGQTRWRRWRWRPLSVGDVGGQEQQQITFNRVLLYKSIRAAKFNV